MKLENRTIVIPWDFSDAAQDALAHAIQVAKSIENNLALLHISHSKSELAKKGKELEEYAKTVESKSGIKTSSINKVGTIFEAIPHVAENDFDTSFVIMKTYGIKGMDKYFGSKASKVIYGSKVPFITIQAPPKRDKIKNIVFPIDYRRENKEKVSWVIDLSKYYDTKIHILLPNTKDKKLIREIRNNLAFTKKLLEAKHVAFDIITMEKKSKFADQTVEYAKKVDADLIVILLSKFTGIKGWLVGIKDQNIIANPYKIPVMCLNPRTDFKKVGGFHG